MTITRISIERIATGTIVDIPGFGPAEVYEIRFDSEGYALDYARSARGGWDDLDMHYVRAGDLVECLNSQTFLRAEKDIPADEVEAKAAALNERALGDVTALILRSVEASTRMGEYRTAAE